jgi:hypothetical protein
LNGDGFPVTSAGKYGLKYGLAGDCLTGNLAVFRYHLRKSTGFFVFTDPK